MADTTTVHIGENSPEHVAFKLFTEIAFAEGMNLFNGAGGERKADRAWILQTYGACLVAVRNPVKAHEGRIER